MYTYLNWVTGNKANHNKSVKWLENCWRNLRHELSPYGYIILLEGLTFLSWLIALTMWRRISLHPRNLSSGDKATCNGCICDGFSNVSNAAWDSNVGVDAAHWRWGRILDGGLITENHKTSSKCTLEPSLTGISISLFKLYHRKKE